MTIRHRKQRMESRRIRFASPAAQPGPSRSRTALLAMLGACVWLVAGCAQPPSVAPVHAGWQAAVARHLDPAQAAPATTAALARGPETTLRPPITGPAHALAGIASYYWQEQTTASGEPFDRAALTAAHRTLPMHSRARVTNLANGRSVVVRINDRGPFKPGRVIDLSEAAARAINMTAQGLAPVRIEVVPDPGHSQ